MKDKIAQIVSHIYKNQICSYNRKAPTIVGKKKSKHHITTYIWLRFASGEPPLIFYYATLRQTSDIRGRYMKRPSEPAARLAASHEPIR